MGKESSNTSFPVLQWLNRMVSEPYYLFHFLTFFSYFVIRSSATQVLAPQLTHNLLLRVTLSPVFLARDSLHIYYPLFPSFAGNTNAISVRRVGSHQGTLKSDPICGRFEFSHMN